MKFLFNRNKESLQLLIEQAEQIVNEDYSLRYSPRSGDSPEVEKLGRLLNELSNRKNTFLEKIQEKESENQAFIESISDGILIMDDQDKILKINSKLESIFELERRDYRKMTIFEIFRDADFFKFLEDLKKSEKGSKHPFSIQVNEKEKHLQAEMSALLSGSNQKIGWILTLNDVTNLQRLELYRKEFISNISHELKTPLTSIKGFVETIIENPDLKPEDQKSYLEIILKQANRLTLIFDNLLVLSKIEKDKGEIPKKLSSVEELCLRVMDWAKEKAQKKKIKILFEKNTFHQADIQYEMNASLVEQAVYNLMDNAIAYSPEGSEIYLKFKSSETEFRLEVHDQGPGIAREHHGRLFERFYRVESARHSTTGGSGLGLSIVKHVVLQHQGKLDLQSEPGKGSRFSLIFPLS